MVSFKNQISGDCKSIENNQSSADVVISKESKRNLVQFQSRDYHNFNSFKITCFKLISQVFSENDTV